jgi:hypothetical protein
MGIAGAHTIQCSEACLFGLDVVAGGAASTRDPPKCPFRGWKVALTLLRSKQSHCLRWVLAKVQRQGRKPAVLEVRRSSLSVLDLTGFSEELCGGMALQRWPVRCLR